MIRCVDVTSARRAAASVGSATGVIGAWLVVAPDAANRALGLDDDLAMRVIGVADLALVPGLLSGRPRWPWVVARAGLNLAIAAFLTWSGARGHARRPLIAAAALAAVTTVDVQVARALRVNQS